MKSLLIAAALLCIFAASSNAKQVYLNDGGVIHAQKAWRSDGRVHVLVNRDTLVDFNNSEVNLKKTFIKKRKVPSIKAKSEKPAAVPSVDSKANLPQTEKKKTGISLPVLPAIPEKSPTAFAGKEEGSIRKHKREMAEKAGE